MDSEKYGFHTRKQTTIYYNQIVPQLKYKFEDSSWHNDICDSIIFSLNEELIHEIQVFFPNSKKDDVDNEYFNTFNVKLEIEKEITNTIFEVNEIDKLIIYINKTVSEYFKKRLEELRVELRAERISYGEIVELQSLVKYIDEGDVELLEAAGEPETKSELKLFRVWVTSTTSYYLDVEAEDKEQALELGKEADGGDFIEDEGSGSWDINYADERTIFVPKDFRLGTYKELQEQTGVDYSTIDKVESVHTHIHTGWGYLKMKDGTFEFSADRSDYKFATIEELMEGMAKYYFI